MADTSKSINVQKRELPQAESSERTRDRRVYVPRADIYETDDNITLLADIPGCDEKSIDITLEKNVLTINAFVENQEVSGHSLSYSEYNTGDYQRVFTLSDEIDRENIEATVKDGVLRLVLPKAGPAKTHKITVKPL